jgi:chromosome segregation protein
MDDGAHFHRSDFQVHTPRDLNWKGAGATTDDERKQWANDLVAACRQKGLQAIAITDHHDVALFKYVRAAALEETDNAGKPLPPHKKLVVFPGVELTLAVPCQALLLLDAEFPVELLPQALLALNVKPAPSPDANEKHAQTVAIEHIRSLETLYAELEKAELLKGRFIVLPHVGESRNHSILRKGFATDYKKMPCVGGFVDGSVSQHGTGNKGILAGENKEWGNKPLAVFQTSDSRTRDFSTLGQHVTWVKWAKPTAEALRQACLARHSRISVIEPRLPDTRITRLEVTNSKFLGPITLEFNPQYNALIGGRGTGKSTILEYVRWALCDQPAGGADADEVAEFQRRRSSLVANTLIPFGASVDVSFLLNSVAHVVRRKANGELSIRIADKPFESCSEDNVRELLPVRAFSQKQLSAVGARLDELRRFVYAPIQSSLAVTDDRISALSSDLRASFALVERGRALANEIAAHALERQSLAERITKLRESLQGLSPEDQATINRQPEYEAEQRVVQTVERDLQAARRAFDSIVTELAKLPSKAERRSGTPNEAQLQTIQTSFERWAKDTVAQARALRAELDDKTAVGGLKPVFTDIGLWKIKREAHRIEYENAKTRSTVHEETLTQIQGLEARQDELTNVVDEKTEQLGALGNPAVKLTELRTEWTHAHRTRSDALKDQCDNLTKLSKDRLRATLNRAADIQPLTDRLIQLVRGTKIRAEKIGQLTAQVSSAPNPLDAWNAILDELLELARLTVEDEAIVVLPPTPRLDSAGLGAKERIAIASQLEPMAWLELALFDLKDLPVFEYQIRADDFIPFQDASPGQQATVLLSILLAQKGPPLLIDQPEDDLNMKIINEIVEMLWEAKSHRQVLFVSHNANLVVNGDAELVICCDYRTSGTESGGKVKLTGAIDVANIRTEITEVMEGGADAFQLRKTKYGF